MGSPRKSPTKKARRVARPRAHPTSAVMVQAAIAALKERRGSSLAAIKKYVAANYKCDMGRINTHIRSAIRNGVAKGTLVQVKGQGASGSFRLGARAKRVDPARAKARRAAAAKRRAAAVARRRARRAATKARRAAAKAKRVAKAKARRAARKAKAKAKRPRKRTAKKTAKPKKKAAPKKKRAAPKKAKKAKKTIKPKRRTSPKKAAKRAPKRK